MNYDNNELDNNEINRINRHKRRVRNRIIAISVFVVLLALIIGGITYAITRVVGDMNTKASIAAAAAASASAASASEEEDINEIIDSLLSEESEVVDPVEPEEEKTPEELLDLEVTNLISQMTIGEKVAGLFIITPEALSEVDLAVRAGDGTKNALSDYPVGGIIYSADNILSQDQFLEMMTNTAGFSKFKLFTCLDEGFGSESILANKLTLENSKDSGEIVETMDPYSAYTEGKIIGNNLSTYGVNAEFGLHNLTVDLTANDEGSFESQEKALFGNEWIVAGQMASQAVTALKESSTFSFASTFPNTGSKEEGSDKRTTNLSKEEFAENGLNVYKACIEAGLSGLVVGNVYVPNMTGDELPASLSKEFMTDYIRVELGYTDVILITDKLNNSEISEYYSSQEACVMALKAGADMVQCPENFKEAYLGVLEAVSKGEISEERIDQSLKRIMKVKYAAFSESSKSDQ